MGLTRNERGTCRAGTHLPVDMAPALCPLAAAPYRNVSQPHSLPHGAHRLSCLPIRVQPLQEAQGCVG